MFDDLTSIYSIFQSLSTNSEKIEYLKELQSRNLPYNINFPNLIHHYENA